jgi:hypothetical protein
LEVARYNYPWYQPVIWGFTSYFADVHPNVFFYFGFDGLIGILALIGIVREWRERRWTIVWLASGMLILFMWPTKWPQYTMSIIPAICIMAAASLRTIYDFLREQESYWNWLSEMLPPPSKWLLWSAGLFAAFIGVIYFSAAIRLAVGRVGWSHISSQQSFLPSTEKGAAIRTPPPSADVPDTWQVFNTSSSGLPSNRVLSLAKDNAGNLWFGTENGLAQFDGKNWKTFHSHDLGLQSEQINALVSDGQQYIYAGTNNGVTQWDGLKWSPLNAFAGDQIFGLFDSNGILWAAALRGVTRFDLKSEASSFYPTESPANHVIVDSDGTTWAATSSGLGRLQNGQWKYYYTGNSALPFSDIRTAAEVKPNVIWAGASKPTSVGGAPVSFDGKNWHAYLPENSGVSDAEPLVIVNNDGQVWIGTRTAGIDIYNLGDKP